jgi:hypothetical protein
MKYISLGWVQGVGKNATSSVTGLLRCCHCSIDLLLLAVSTKWDHCMALKPHILAYKHNAAGSCALLLIMRDFIVHSTDILELPLLSDALIQRHPGLVCFIFR